MEAGRTEEGEGIAGGVGSRLQRHGIIVLETD